MQSAADGLAVSLSRTSFRAPRVPVVSNVTGTYHAGDPASIRDELVRQLMQPVLWQRCMERMIRDGAARFVEFGPGRVLTGLLRKIDRKAASVNVNSMEALQAMLQAAAP